MLLYEGYNLVRRYGQRVAFSLLHLRIAQGSVLALTGPNGSGKSTLLRMLAFLEKPDAGELHFYGSPHVHPRHQATLLLQEPYLLKRSVFENVAYGLKVRGQTDNIQEAVETALGSVGFVSSILHRQWRELSGGERQRVALAARLVLQPKALLLDEPTSNVDSRSAVAIRQAVAAAVQAGSTVVVASHDHAWLTQLDAHTLCLEE